MRVALCVLVCLMAIGAVTASARVDEFDEAAVLAELGESPAASQSGSVGSLMSLSDLGAEELALLEADASESDAAAQLLAMQQQEPAAPSAAPAAAAAAAPAKPTAAAAAVPLALRGVVQRNGAVKGGDSWLVAGARPVYTAVDGTPIGFLSENAEVVAEHYQFLEKKDANGRVNGYVQWAYGYVFKAQPHVFGGWAGANACGWFQLSRETDEPDHLLKATFQKSHPQVVPKCPGVASGALARSAVFKQGSFLETSPTDLVKAGTKAACSAFLNYDPKSGLTSGPVPALARGVYSGTGAMGNVPAVVQQEKKVDGFGVLAVTKDGKFALVKYPHLAPTTPRAEVFFVTCDCIEFDAEAVQVVNAANKPVDSAAAKPAAKPEKAALLEMPEVEDSMLVELHTESHAQLGLSNDGARGNYPGWNSMIELASENAPLSFEGPNKAGPGAPVKNFPPAAENVRHVKIAAGETSAQLKEANTGVSKVHVHVYGKANMGDDKERRLKNMVKRLANRQSESYQKINRLLRKLKNCARSGKKGCLSKITNKLEDWKAEFVERP